MILSEVLLYAKVCISQVAPSFFYMLKGFVIIYQKLRIAPMAKLCFSLLEEGLDKACYCSL